MIRWRYSSVQWLTQCKNSLEVTGNPLFASRNILTCSFCTKFIFWSLAFRPRPQHTPLLTFPKSIHFGEESEFILYECNTKLLLLDISLPHFWPEFWKLTNKTPPQQQKAYQPSVCFYWGKKKKNMLKSGVCFLSSWVFIRNAKKYLNKQMEIVSLLLASKSSLAVISHNHYAEVILLKYLLSHHILNMNNAE